MNKQKIILVALIIAAFLLAVGYIIYDMASLGSKEFSVCEPDGKCVEANRDEISEGNGCGIVKDKVAICGQYTIIKNDL